MALALSIDGVADWAAPRHSVLKAISVGTGSFPLAFATAWTLWPAVTPRVEVAERLAFAAELLVAPAVIVMLAVVGCFRLFDTARAEDPFANAESQAWKVNQRVLSNTIEQAWIFVPVLLGLAVRVAPEHQKLLPMATALWCTGRLLFWAGYRLKPEWRALGFDWTMWTSVVLVAWFVFTLL